LALQGGGDSATAQQLKSAINSTTTTPVPAPAPAPAPVTPAVYVSVLSGNLVVVNTPPAPTFTSSADSSTGSLTSVEGTDTGSSMFSSISPSSGASSSGGSKSGSGTSGTTGSTGGGNGPSNATPPADSGDRAMNVVAQPPAVQPVNHAKPLPQKVTKTLSQGLVDQFQPSGPPASHGTPGINTNFSSSGSGN
jgi:hypothetical protein